jgi:hypothetical protein
MGITDRLTKGVILECMDDISAEAVARRLFLCYFPYHGTPTTITSDQGPQFVGDVWTHLCTWIGVKRRLSTALINGVPSSDGRGARVDESGN